MGARGRTMRGAARGVTALALFVGLVFACVQVPDGGGDPIEVPSPDRSDAGGGGGGGDDSDLDPTVTDEDDDAGPEPEPDASDEAAAPDAGNLMACGGPNDECPAGKYMAGCTGGKCFGTDCCCTTSRQCRAGSFPVCCPEGEVCKDSANGTCGPP